jgi:hypothetical protein
LLSLSQIDSSGQWMMSSLSFRRAVGRPRSMAATLRAIGERIGASRAMSAASA